MVTTSITGKTTGAVTLMALALLLAVLALSAQARAACPNEAIREAQRSTSLPDCRAYEQVSSTQKNGTGVVSESMSTRAAADGNALQFLSLGAFADAVGTGIATDYMSERTGAPETPGWVTHAISPPQSSTTFDGVNGGFDPVYQGEFSDDLSTGVFSAQSSLTDDPSTVNVPNLYLRRDLLSPGAGSYDLITHCPLCETTSMPLPAPETITEAVTTLPWLAWMSPDGNHVVFESGLQLTADTPLALKRVEVYEWNNGTVALAGRVPKAGGSFCDDVNGPACVGSQRSIAGQGQGATGGMRTPDVVSDGSDGHTRVFFTFPTVSGVTPDPSLGGHAGQLYMRVDGTSTVKLNVSERETEDKFAPASFLDASTNGERVFFMTSQALTDDAPVNGEAKIYMYDASKPPSAAGHLTLINADHEPGDGESSTGAGIVGLSRDGNYVYFVSDGQIVSGEQSLGGAAGLYLWHEGVVRYITDVPGLDGSSTFTTGANFVTKPRQARVSPDGRWLLYPEGSDTTRQFYLYNADSNAVPVCVSCNPSGTASTVGATDVAKVGSSASKAGWHENHALADDGSRVFFSTVQALVPEDVNGKEDVYEYDTSSGSVHLISTGTSPEDSWFMDASANGDNVFFTTTQQLVGWDTDQEYDIYDARIDGGFPKPPVTQACSGDACQGPAIEAPGLPALAGLSFTGLQNPSAPVVVKKSPGAQKLRVALRACRKKKGRVKRKRCEAAARKRYAKQSSRASGRTK